MRAAVVASIAALLSPWPAAVDAKASIFLQPHVQRIVGMIPRSVAKQLIQIGERTGFNVTYESIDEHDSDEKYRKKPSQSIDVYTLERRDKDYDEDEDEDDREPDIEHTEIWEVLQPYLPKIVQAVKDNRNHEEFSKIFPDDPDRDPELNWIFFRKYSPNTVRNSLKHHQDTNMNTLNIELSDDYEGGGLFYIKPLVATGEIYKAYPNIGYNWIETVERRNRSDLIFPDLHPGDAIFYNYTVEHGVAPVKSGIRYSMAFFFDTDNPAARDTDDDDDDLEEGQFKVELINEVTGVTVDIVEVFSNGTIEMHVENVTSDEKAKVTVREGTKIRAVRVGTDEVVVDDMIMEENRTTWTIARDADYLEPTVQRHVGVLPPSVCKKLVELGEKAGFDAEDESIDEDEQKDPDTKYVPSQSIDVYERASQPGKSPDRIEISDEDIWEVLEPFIQKITQIVKENRNKEGFAEFYPDDPDREPDLNWIFFRKYSPNDERNSLQHHHDTNMNTLNIEMSDDYEGGGLFYIRPLRSTGEMADEYDDVWKGYDWINSVKRENTTDRVFPDLHTGDAIFYNYTVDHAVAPIESGTRYSMAFFFDMDNPAVKDEFEEDIDEDEFEVKLVNSLPGTNVDIVRVINEKVLEFVFDDVTFNKTQFYDAHEGEKLRALKAGTMEKVSEFVIERGQPLYTISLNDSSQTDEL